MSGRRRQVACLAALAAALGACAQPAPAPPSTPEVARLEELAQIFYVRVSNRRFNSISTFHDPALREFFHSPGAFADYYADFADDLAMASFEYNRPNSFVIEDFEFESDGSVQIRIVFTGESNKPLRFWNTRLLRSDRWEYADGRWWITPGKL
ncbi:MAG: hypothetical protein VCC02_00310 [Myxococcota bacterium]